MLEFLKSGKMPAGRNDRALMVEELEHWGLGDIEVLKLQEIMFEKPPKMVGDNCYNKWASLDPLNIQNLVNRKLITIDETLEIEDFDENKTTNYEG